MIRHGPIIADEPRASIQPFVYVAWLHHPPCQTLIVTAGLNIQRAIAQTSRASGAVNRAASRGAAQTHHASELAAASSSLWGSRRVRLGVAAP